MVENNFRILLATQKKKMSDVEKDTNLSKGSIRSLYYETSKGIQFKTLATICEYLKCDVGDLIKLKEEEEANERIEAF